MTKAKKRKKIDNQIICTERVGDPLVRESLKMSDEKKLKTQESDNSFYIKFSKVTTLFM